SVVFFFNVVAAFVFPSLGQFLHMSTPGFGLFAGTAVNDTSSVTATAAIWDGMMGTGTQALDYATIVKLTRTCAIIPIVLVLAAYGVMKAKRNQTSQGEPVKVSKIFPHFIIYFVLASVFTTACIYFGAQASDFKPLKELAKFMITMAMLAIGLNTNVVKLIKTGGKALALGLVCWVAISVVSLYVQHLIGQW
ncbi:MAG: putative sulfate exporter family transporter, partial [Veillonella sp.]|nr:putative sulfate exporter family transporter [Veillonella sp.]